MNWLEKTIGFVFPSWAIQRQHAKQISSYYDTTSITPKNKRFIDRGTPDESNFGASEVMYQVRENEHNNDLVNGALNIITSSITGGKGFMLLPTVQKKDGSLDSEFNSFIKKEWDKWMKNPLISGDCHGVEVQNLLIRTVMRDGGCLINWLYGNEYPHNTGLPFSLQLIEYDYLSENGGINEPSKTGNTICDGVEKNEYGQEVAYWIHTPTDRISFYSEPKRYDARTFVHLKNRNRFGVSRGVSIFHSVLKRMNDVREYDTTERMAARLAAAMMMQVTTDPDAAPSFSNYNDYSDETKCNQQEFSFAPGAVFDQLKPGQEIKLIKADRPNTNLDAFRKGQLRMMTGSLRVNYGQLTGEMGSSYSAERQNNLNTEQNLTPLQLIFANYLSKIYVNWLIALISSKGIASKDIAKKMSQGIDLFSHSFTAPIKPSINPLQDAKAYKSLLEDNVISRTQVMKSLGLSPDETDKQRKDDEDRERKYGIREQ